MSNNQYHLIVVGGGIAGLYFIQQYLQDNPQSKNKILLLETQFKLGGRISTTRYKKEIYESGAGRFSDHHVHLKQLLKDLKLDKKTIPIPSGESFFGQDGQPDPKLKFDLLLAKVIKLLKDHSDLRSKTIYQILKEIDPTLATQLDRIYPYYSELHIMDAFDALESFERDFKTVTSYNVLDGGLEQIIKKLEKKIKKKIEISYGDGLYDLEKESDHQWRLITYSRKEYLTSGVVLAIPQKPLLTLSALKPIYPLLRLVSGQPLYRIYAKFEKNWLKKKIVTDSILKFIIPINDDGLVLISYTDGPLTEKWSQMMIQGTLKENIEKELHKLFPDLTLPKILWTDGSSYWEVGAHYWKPRKTHFDQEELIKKINHPFKNLYIIGEAYSPNQAWIEGALKTTQMALDNLKKNPFLKSEIPNQKQKGSGKKSQSKIKTKEYTWEEIAQHKTRNDAWLVIKGKVYDITSWISQHPGGDIIIKGLGIDATELFVKFRHSPRAYQILKDYQIGLLKKSKN